jgi:hypothetical protein
VSAGEALRTLELRHNPGGQRAQTSQTVQIAWVALSFTITSPNHHFLIAMDDPANYGIVCCFHAWFPDVYTGP